MLTFAPSAAAHLEHPGVGGIEAVLVQRDRQHGRVVEEDLLGAVAVVDVPVDDRHPAEAALALRPARRDRRVVEEAEAHRRVALGVVAGRAQDRERVVDCARRAPRSTASSSPPAASSIASCVPGPRPGLVPELDPFSERAARRAPARHARGVCTSRSSSSVANRAGSSSTCASTPEPSSTCRVRHSRSAARTSPPSPTAAAGCPAPPVAGRAARSARRRRAPSRSAIRRRAAAKADAVRPACGRRGAGSARRRPGRAASPRASSSPPR